MAVVSFPQTPLCVPHSVMTLPGRRVAAALTSSVLLIGVIDYISV